MFRKKSKKFWKKEFKYLRNDVVDAIYKASIATFATTVVEGAVDGVKKLMTSFRRVKTTSEAQDTAAAPAVAPAEAPAAH